MVKRDAFRPHWLSAYEGSNPSSRIIMLIVHQAMILYTKVVSSVIMMFFRSQIAINNFQIGSIKDLFINPGVVDNHPFIKQMPLIML